MSLKKVNSLCSVSFSQFHRGNKIA